MTDCQFLEPLGFSATIAERFARKVQILDSGCHEWTGGRSGSEGYGSIRRGAPRHGYARAHRVAWMLHHGALIPEGAVVRHKCDNPPCVNPAHLELGTDADNARDKVARGRQPSHVGEANPNRRLSERDVSEIRSLLAEGKSHGHLAARFAVSKSLIGAIWRREIWKEVV